MKRSFNLDRWGMVAVLVAVGLGCAGCRKEPNEIEREFGRIEASIVPDGGRVVAQKSEWDESSRSMSWTISLPVDVTFDDYLDRVQGQLSGYTRVTHPGADVLLRKSTDGDTITLHLQSAPQGMTVTVRAEARPF